MSKELNEQSKFQVGLPHIPHHHFPLDHTGPTGPASSLYPPNYHAPEHTITSITSHYILWTNLYTNESRVTFGYDIQIYIVIHTVGL